LVSRSRIDLGLSVGFLVVLAAPLAARSVQERMQTSIDVAVGGPPILATGDTLALVVRRYRCIGDVCDLVGPLSGPVRWTSSAPRVLHVDTNGILRGRSAGRAKVTGRSASGPLSVDVRVLPPVRTLGWSPLPRVLRAGDTIRVAVIARNAAGGVVARLAPVAHIGGTGAAGQVLWLPAGSDAASTRVYLDRPGTLVLVARLADRVDTLRARVR
jgi:hypothetical protein